MTDKYRPPSKVYRTKETRAWQDAIDKQASKLVDFESINKCLPFLADDVIEFIIDTLKEEKEIDPKANYTGEFLSGLRGQVEDIIWRHLDKVAQ